MLDRWMDAMDKPALTRNGWDGLVIFMPFIIALVLFVVGLWIWDWWKGRRK